jgi:hypothetical protein
MLLAFVVAALASAGAATGPDACTLLDDDDIRAVQGVAPAARVPSRQPGAMRLEQCFFRTADHTSSVSLAVAPQGRAHWERQFHGEKARALRAGLKKEKPPEPVQGLGDEAFWVGDSKVGALYARKGEMFVRVSVGGGAEATRPLRARRLAEKALSRLETATL